MREEPVVAVAGATGVVGNEMLSILEERKFPASEVRLLASSDSEGEKYSVFGDEVVVETLGAESFNDVDIALFATSSELSAEFVPIAVEAGAVAIDNSSHFRMHDGIPLIVPEVNAAAIPENPTIIANPNCSTIQLVPVLAVIQEAAGLKRVVVSTYQSVSGAGKYALDELWEQTKAIFSQQEVVPDAPTGAPVSGVKPCTVHYRGRLVSDATLRRTLQQVSEYLNRDISITSGDRIAVLNGNKRSHHLLGRAADFTVTGMKLSDAFDALKKAKFLASGYQLIYHTEETVAPHLHLGRYADARPSSFSVDRGSILPARKRYSGPR